MSSSRLEIRETELPGVFIVTPRVFRDERGFFLESFNAATFAEAGIDARFVQDNHSRSAKGVLRGMHYQLNRPQGKLVRAVRGRIFDVAADIRRGSPTFGKWVGVTLDDNDMSALWIPAGFAHGFCALSDGVDVTYKCTEFYAPEDERGVLWNDPLLGIQWPVENPLVAAKDLSYPLLQKESSDLPAFVALS
ncbi:MAG: dTDP-4-dehydrorhamnose 3,5-epimerase [Gemmatimonadota bacterium]|nr:dTDP-4-dehydrorhamnose 3,5-epimerase [Gemmatimonadota bacterium]